MRGKLLEHGHRRRLVVYKHAPLASRRNLAPQNERSVVRLVQTIGFQNPGQRLLCSALRLKHRGHHGTLGPGANHIARSLVAQQQRQCAHQDRLPRPGLARQQVEPLPELHHQVVDHRVVLEPHFNQHRSVLEKPKVLRSIA